MEGRLCKSQIVLRHKQQMCVRSHFARVKSDLLHNFFSGRERGSKFLRLTLKF